MSMRGSRSFSASHLLGRTFFVIQQVYNRCTGELGVDVVFLGVGTFSARLGR